MNLIEIIFPGVSFFCSVTLIILGLMQVHLYLLHREKRSKYLAAFCILMGLSTTSDVLVYAQYFSGDITRIYVESAQFLLFLGLFYYFKSLSFYIAIPKWLRSFYGSSMVLFSLLALIPPIGFFLFNKNLFFNPDNIHTTGRYFVDAYTSRLGDPYQVPLIFFSLFSLVHSFTSFYLLMRLMRSSMDGLLMFGMFFNIVGCGMQFLVLPLTIDYYIPLLFLSNIFEALRMCSLASRESRLHGLKKQETSKIDDNRDTYKDKSFDEERLKSLGESLSQLMVTEKLYLNADLKISHLAKLLRIPDYLVSQVLRFSLGKNFYQWVNEFRIEEVKRRLKSADDSQQTIMDIAFDSGFNSKSSFNNAFKKMVGQTPSRFRKEHGSQAILESTN